jgi:hypothetical protein
MMKKTIRFNHEIQRWLRYLISILFGLIFLTSCYFPSSPKVPDTRFFENINEFATNPVNIQFQLKLSESVSENESIVLEILDDVTGLPYNIQRNELDHLYDQIYYANISVPSGSIIKYRYARIAESLYPEVSPDGELITYRLYYASMPAIVQDVHQAWQGEAHGQTMGWLLGTLRDQETNLPIPDILVSAGGRRTFTDANGKYLLDGLGEGIHNVVFYAIDGKYRTFQQGASINAGMQTPADVNLVQMPEVNITFQVSPPNDALGAPIYIAGNIFQLGNTFTDLFGSMSIKPNRMPVLKQNPDGTLAVTLSLYAETDLRYKFTLGDGYWNAEQKDIGEFRIRQLIVPAKDVTINHTIEAWRTSGIEPITFSVKIPPDTSPFDTKYIQFEQHKIEQWTEPIPLWPLGDGQYLYILFSPLEIKQPVKYQFCRNEDCIHATDTGSLSFEREVVPSDAPQTVALTLDSWHNWYSFEKNASVLEAYIPTKPASYKAMVELSPKMNPSWLVHGPAGINALVEMGADTIVFSPQWTVSDHSPNLRPEIGSTPFYQEMIVLLNSAESQGFEVILFPQIGPQETITRWWHSGNQTDAWWELFFLSYRDFIINYAKLAQDSSASHLILGGKSLLPAFNGGVLPDGSESTIPPSSDDYWLDLLAEIQNVFDGKLIWSTNVHLKMDPLPNFIDRFDGIHVSLDSPLAFGDHPTFEMIQSGLISVIDNHIYEVYRSTQKPITLAMAYPAIETAASGCALLNEACYNDGLFFADEMIAYAVDLQEQALIYNAVFPIIASRDWITATSIRGYNPIVTVHDGASSIAGKPAFDVVQYWFTSMKP